MTDLQSRGPSSSVRAVDLHAHTTASDGAASPTELVASARAAGLSAIAVTDHDTLAGVAEAQAEGVRLGVRVVPGVELSAMDAEREVHLLGLHLDRPAVLRDSLTEFQETRTRRAQEIVHRLNALGIPVTFDAVLRQAQGGAIGRPHLARALIAGGWVRDSRDAFDRYLAAGRPAYVPKHRLLIADAIALVHAGGGLAIVAHPGPDGRRETVERYVAMGLDGVEVRHPGHSAEDVARLGTLAEFFGLVPSGGSDWHGAAEGARVLGAMNIPHAWLEMQDERVARQRARERVA